MEWLYKLGVYSAFGVLLLFVGIASWQKGDLVAAIVGALLGVAIGYFAGKFGGKERHD